MCARSGRDKLQAMQEAYKSVMDNDSDEENDAEVDPPLVWNCDGTVCWTLSQFKAVVREIHRTYDGVEASAQLIRANNLVTKTLPPMQSGLIAPTPQTCDRAKYLPPKYFTMAYYTSLRLCAHTTVV
jgi:hypothetical protein